MLEYVIVFSIVAIVTVFTLFMTRFLDRRRAKEEAEFEEIVASGGIEIEYDPLEGGMPFIPQGYGFEYEEWEVPWYVE